MPVVGPTIFVIGGLVAVAVGFANWRSGGMSLASLGVLIAAGSGVLLVWDSTAPWRDPAVAVLAILAIAAQAWKIREFVQLSPQVRRETWRKSRLLVLLGGAIILGILASELFTGVPVAAQYGWLGLIGLLTAAFIVLVVVQAVTEIRAAFKAERARSGR